MTTEMTPEKLRSVALAMDLLDQLAGEFLRSARDGIAVNAETVTVTMRLDGEAWKDEEFLTDTIEWLEGDGMQQDLRAWAEALEADDPKEHYEHE